MPYKDLIKRNECARLSMEKRRKLYPAQIKEIENRFLRNHPGFNANNSHASRSKLRKQVLSLLGNKCTKCAFSDWRGLHIDHIHGKGCQERRLFGSNYYAYLKYIHQKILDNPKNHGYQILCATCNSIKRYENREYGGVNHE